MVMDLNSPCDPVLALPDVTLCCIDTTARWNWSLRALRLSMALIRFGRAVFFIDDPEQLAGSEVPADLEVVQIGPLRSVQAYSDFVVDQLPDFVRTTHVLLVQWDGYVLHPDRWLEDYLRFDYIGAPWTHVPPPGNVGNGGFSLRSLRLMQAVRELRVGCPVHPEDWFIGVTCRAALEARGICFADPKLAMRFSIEDGEWDNSSRPFGFHAPYHFPQVLSSDELQAFVASLRSQDLGAWWMGNLLREMRRWARSDPRSWHGWQSWLSAALDEASESWCVGQEATALIKALIRYSYGAHAKQLLNRRAVTASTPVGDLQLSMRARATVLRDYFRLKAR